MSASRPLRPVEQTAAGRLRVALEEAEASLSDLAQAEIPPALGELERLKALLGLRLVVGDSRTGNPQPDRLLTAEEAAARLSLAPDTLYRKAASFPFTVRLPGRLVRFSEAGIERFIRSRQGR